MKICSLLALYLFIQTTFAQGEAKSCTSYTQDYHESVLTDVVAAAGIDYGTSWCYFFDRDGGKELYVLLPMLESPALALEEGENILQAFLGGETQIVAFPDLSGWRLEASFGNGVADLAYGTPAYLADFLGWEVEEFQGPNFYRLVYILYLNP